MRCVLGLMALRGLAPRQGLPAPSLERPPGAGQGAARERPVFAVAPGGASPLDDLAILDRRCELGNSRSV